ncbi:hypothetical protein TrVFT333_010973 [Trichoderma virens FT-333]|nr:hypothetical protein TrVFT333_010973 [Trichoderma virens FT-333]
MAAYSKAQLPSLNGYDATRYQDAAAAFEPYPAQSFSTQQTEKFAQMNQQSFANNNNVAHYMSTGPTVVSLHPTSGVCGTTVSLKISSQDDLFSLSSTQPSVMFGTTKYVVDLIRDVQDNSGFVYSCSVDAPPSGGNNNVPLSLVIDSPAGVEISRTMAGTFHYLEGSVDDITRTDKLPKDDTTTPAAEMDQASPSPKTEAPSSAATNTYEYPPTQGQYGNAFATGNTDMITTYRTTSFTDPHYHHHHRRSHQGWTGGAYGSTTLAAVGRSSSTFDPISISGRSTGHHLPIPSSGSSGAPQLVRTSTITNSSGNGSYHSMSLYTPKAVLNIRGKLSEMARDWNQEEWENRRRIVMFKKTQNGAVLNVSFKAVAVNERPSNSICISCIWWAEKSECYVTSVDTIHLLEQLVAAPNRFSVEEKNRIRRNLEGFHPSTVSKAKPDSEEFFKIIMAFPHPKPRNIEKDVKVFPWTALEPALKKIISKYSASPSSILPPATSTSSYATLPTPPSHHGIGSQHGLSSQHADHSQYPLHSAYGSAHHEAIPSPRSQASWAPYSSAARGLSPTLRNHHSPQQSSSMRINTSTAQLPAVSAYDTRGVAASPYGSTGLHTPISHHPATATPPRWDTTPAAYPDSGYPGLTSQPPPGASSVYSTAAYGEPSHRA